MAHENVLKRDRAYRTVLQFLIKKGGLKPTFRWPIEEAIKQSGHETVSHAIYLKYMEFNGQPLLLEEDKHLQINPSRTKEVIQYLIEGERQDFSEKQTLIQNTSSRLNVTLVLISLLITLSISFPQISGNFSFLVTFIFYGFVLLFLVIIIPSAARDYVSLYHMRSKP